MRRGLLLVIGVVMVIAGGLSVTGTGMTTTRKEKVFQIGDLSATAPVERTWRLPLWAGIPVLIVGVGLLVTGFRSRIDSEEPL